MKAYNGSSVLFHPVQPAAELKEYVDFYYQGESNTPAINGMQLNISALFLPVNSVEITLNYHDTSVRFRNKGKSASSSGFIVGTHNLQTLYVVDDFGNVNKSFHIRFKPSGFSKLFGISQSELKNTFFTVNEVLGKEGKDLEDKFNNSVSLSERVKIVNSFLIHRKKKSKRLKRIELTNSILKILDSNNCRIKVKSLTKELGLPERTLQWEFLNHIGLTPKEFIRIFRFKRILNEMLSGNKLNWAEAAQASGYYDQAHLINEFKEATNLTPDLFLKEAGKSIIKSINLLIFIQHNITFPSSLSTTHYSFIEDFTQIEKMSIKLL